MVMTRYLIFILLIISSRLSLAQQIPVPRLLSMLNWNDRQIDTTLKKEGYLLMKKDADDAGTLYQYSWFDKQKDGKAVVRSFNYMDASVRNMKSRLITYRTYNKAEYQDIASWLLANNYHATANFDFDEQQHTLYSNGSQIIRVKVITIELKDKRKYVAYELEIGK
mgnify:CR=1 FL=1|jgi:hypothetical protein